MPPASQSKLALSAMYSWPDPQLSRLAEALKNDLLPALGDGGRFRVDLIKEGNPEITHTYETIEAFCEGVNFEQVPDSIQINLGAGDYSFSVFLVITASLKKVDVRITSTAAMVQKASVYLKTIQDGLQLALVQERPAQEPDEPVNEKINYYSSYRKKKPDSPDWMLQAIGLLQAYIGAVTYCNASFFLSSAPQYRHDFNDIVKLKESLPAQWAGMATLRVSFSGRRKTASLDCAFDRSEVSLNIEGLSKDEIETFVKSTEPALGIEPIKEEQRYQFDGSRRNYFTKDSIEKDWLQRAVHIAASFFFGKRYFNGGLNLTGSGGNITYGGEDGWRQALLQNWDGTDAAYFSMSGDEGSVGLNVDLRRELVALDVRARSADLIERIFQAFETGLGLEKIAGIPYRYRRFSRRYKIKGEVDNGDLATAIDEAVKTGFPGKYVVQDAYVEEVKGSRSLQPFTTVPDFVQFLKKAPGKKYQTVYLFLQGPKEGSLTIWTDLEAMELNVYTTFQRAEFNKIVDTIEDKIDLKLIEEKKNEAKEKSSDKEKSPWSKVVLPLLGLLISGSAIVIISESFPRYSLQMTRPAMDEKDGLLALPNGKVFLDWLLKKKQFWHEVTENTPTTIRIYNGEQIPVKTITGQHTGVTLPLEAGTFDIELVNELSSDRPHVRVFVPKAGGDTAARR